MNVERITASDFLKAQDRARRNAAENPAFRNISKQLKDLPKSQERLAFEFIMMALQALERGASPRAMIVKALYFEGAIESAREPEYLAHIENVIFRCFELLGQVKTGTGEYTSLQLTLSLTLMAVRKRDRNRFSLVLETLRHSLGEPDEDPRFKILAKVASRR